ncbi:MAG: ABC transporter permease [Nitrososphaerota archaeon]
MGLTPLVQKEIKELMRERTIMVGVILLPLILFPLMGFTISAGITSASDRLVGMDVLYIDMDQDRFSERLGQLLGEAGLRLRSGSMAGDMEETLSRYGVRAAIVVPADFTEKIFSHEQAVVGVYMRIENPTPASLQYVSSIGSIVESSSRKLGEELARQAGVDIEYYSSPFSAVNSLFYRGRVIEAGVETVTQLYLAINFMLPLVVLMVAATAGSVAATSVGLEKEAKTLEMLLTLPISRLKILLAKLSGSVFIALLGTISFMAGFTFYLYSLTQRQTLIPIRQNNVFELIGLTPASMILLGLTMGIALFITLGLGILAGVLAGDVRGGQQLAGLLQFPLFLIPFLVLQFTDFQDLSPHTATALLADPITHIFLAIRAITATKYTEAATYLSITLLFMIALLALASWFFSGERLVTMRLRIRRTTGD